MVGQPTDWIFTFGGANLLQPQRGGQMAFFLWKNASEFRFQILISRRSYSCQAINNIYINFHLLLFTYLLFIL